MCVCVRVCLGVGEVGGAVGGVCYLWKIIYRNLTDNVFFTNGGNQFIQTSILPCPEQEVSCHGIISVY